MRGTRPSILWCGLCLLSACTDLPGEVVGTYRVSLTQTENTCGAQAVYALPKQYSFELRTDGERGYFRAAGQTPVQGSYDEPDFSFKFSSVVAQSAPDAGTAFCRLIQAETIRGSVGEADDDEAEVRGEHLLDISTDPSTDCRDALTPEGAFLRLPCEVRYELSGHSREGF